MDDRGSSGVPEGWEQSVLSQGIELISGQHIEASRCNDYGLGSPYLTGPADFPNDKIIVTKYTEDPKVTCEKGDILLTVKGSGTGKSIIANNEYCISRQLMAVRPKDYDAGFVFYILKSNEENYGSKSTGLIPGITRDDVLKTSVCLPPLEEQRKIAEILSTWDEAIEQQTRLIELKRERKRGLMQQLLTGKVRFKEFEGLEWKTLQLGKLIVEVNVRNRHLVCKRVLSVTNHSGFVLPEEQFSKRVASSDLSNYKVVRRGQFAYNPSRINVGSLARLDIFDEGVISPMYVVFASTQHIDRDFLLYWLYSPLAAEKIKRSTQGSVRDSVNFSALSELKIALPSFPEQQKIAAVLSAADDELATLTTQLEALRLQKRGLMQQLLTGKTRVQVA